MKSRTSFFNSTVLKKDITRFAPVWGLYTVFALMFVLLMWESEGSAARFMNNAPYILQSMGILNLCYGGLCAVVLFADLFNSKLCNALHAMPMRREGWFLTHLTAGLLFCIVPNALSALVAALLLQQYAYGAFLWLAVTVLQFLFFFGVGVFSVMCAGNKLGAVAVYGIINFFAFIATWLAVTFYEPVLYGITLDADRLVNYSPVAEFSQSGYLLVDYDNMTQTAVFGGFVSQEWRYLFIAAAVGVALTAAGLLIYRKRKLESAGDLIAAKPAAPVFLVIYTLCVGAVMYFVADLATQTLRYIFLLLGLAIGFFTGRMLLERKVNVFRGKNFLGFGVLVAVFAASIGLTWLDPAGVTRYVPEVEQVESVQISPYTSMYYRNTKGCALTEQADIAVITQIHSQMVKDRSPGETDMALCISYELRGGTSVERQYYIDSKSDVGQLLKGYYSAPEYVFGTDDLQSLLSSSLALEFQPYSDNLPAVGVGVSEQWLDTAVFREKFGTDAVAVTHLTQGSLADDATVKGLIDAVVADCNAGNMAQVWEYHHNDAYGYLVITYETQDGHYHTNLEITVYSDCTNTVNYLKSLIPQ